METQNATKSSAQAEQDIYDTLNAVALKVEALLSGAHRGPRIAALRLIKSNLETVIALVGDDRP